MCNWIEVLLKENHYYDSEPLPQEDWVAGVPQGLGGL